MQIAIESLAGDGLQDETSKSGLSGIDTAQQKEEEEVQEEEARAAAAAAVPLKSIPFHDGGAAVL